MKRVYVAATPIDAQFVCTFLESVGIHATVRGEHLFTLRGLVPVTEDTLPAVWVTEDEDYERAVVEEDGSAAGEDEGWDAAGEKLG